MAPHDSTPKAVAFHILSDKPEGEIIKDIVNQVMKYLRKGFEGTVDISWQGFRSGAQETFAQVKITPSDVILEGKGLTENVRIAIEEALNNVRLSEKPSQAVTTEVTA